MMMVFDPDLVLVSIQRCVVNFTMTPLPVPDGDPDIKAHASKRTRSNSQNVSQPARARSPHVARRDQDDAAAQTLDR